MGLKRLGAAVAALLIVGVPGLTQAATLRPLDRDGLNLRSGPGTTFQVVGGLSASQSAFVLAEENGWFKVRTASGLEAWVSGLFSRISYEDEQADVIVNTDVLNVREQPGLDAPVLVQIKQDERARLLERLGDWWRVRLPGGAEGWVSAQYMRRAGTEPATPPTPTTPTPPGPTTPTPPGPTPPPPPTPTTPTPPGPTPPPPPTPTPPPAPAPQVPAIQPAPASAVPSLPLVTPPAPLPLGSKTVTVRTAAGVYSGRDTGAFDRIDNVKPGNALTYLGAAEGWVKVQTARGSTGWIPGENVQIAEGRLAYELTEGRWSVSYGAQQGPAPAPAPEPGAVIERRAVRDADGLRLREAPSLDGKIIDVLSQGDIMDVLESRAPWLRVLSSQGKTGWVHGDFTIVMPPRQAAPAPAPAPAPQPAGGPSLQATLQASAPGVLRLEVTAKGLTLGQPTVDGTTLLVPAPTGQAQAAILPIGSDGASFLSVNGAGLLLSLEKAPGWKVLEQTPAKVVVEIRPTVTAIAVSEAADRTVYSFRATGTAAPRASASGANVLLDFPGAFLGLGAPAPAGIQVEQTATGVRVTVPSRRAYALKRTQQGFELHLYKPGLAGKTILLDPGHGGDDPGAANRSTGVREKEINLQIALRVRAYLAATGANTLMTRATDTRSVPAEVIRLGGDDLTHIDLGYRTRMANEVNVDTFFSIHHNAGDSSGGTETWYTSGTLNGSRSADLARLLQRTLTGPLGQRDRGAKDDLMYVTRNTDAPAVLLEVAFLDHRLEQYLVADPAFQDKVARLIVQTLEQFYAER